MDSTTPSFFVYAKRKSSKEKLARIYIRIHYETETMERSTPIVCEYTQWNPSSTMINNDKHLSDQLKLHLEEIRHKIMGAYYILMKNSPEVSLAEIVAVALDDERAKMFSVFTCFNTVIEKLKSAKGREGASASNIQKHQVVLNHLKAYAFDEHRWRDFPFSRINRSFIDGFVAYLKNVALCGHNTAMKHLAIFKKIYKIADDNHWIKMNAFAGLKMGKRPVSRTILTEEEIDVIARKVLPVRRIEFVRDMFIFACFTGLAYIDLKNLQRRHLQNNYSMTWIKIKRTKTGVDATVPLFEPARVILDRWSQGWEEFKSDQLLFNMLSNQKTNAFLKEIALICGIEKPVSFHVARHSFATSIALSNNIPLETVSKMLGHSRVSMTQHYSKVIDSKIAKDSNFLMNKFNKNNNSQS